MQIKTRKFSVNAISYESTLINSYLKFSFFYDNVIAVWCIYGGNLPKMSLSCFAAATIEQKGIFLDVS